jgi:hypothetical protein
MEYTSFGKPVPAFRIIFNLFFEHDRFRTKRLQFAGSWARRYLDDARGGAMYRRGGGNMPPPNGGQSGQPKPPSRRLDDLTAI